MGWPVTAQNARTARTPPIPTQDLLADALVLVAAVEPVGDAAQVGLVLLDVGVEQQQRHAPDGGLPDPRRERAVARHRDLDEHRLAGGVGEQLQRQALRVEHRVVSRAASRPATATGGSSPER